LIIQQCLGSGTNTRDDLLYTIVEYSLLSHTLTNHPPYTRALEVCGVVAIGSHLNFMFNLIKNGRFLVKVNHILPYSASRLPKSQYKKYLFPMIPANIQNNHMYTLKVT
jgi:hypothetical protein